MAAKAPGKGIFRIFLVLILVVLAAVATLGYLLTMEVPVPRSGKLNKLDSKEAARKIKLISEAFLTGKKGFVRLSDVELNSFLKENVHIPSTGPTNELAALRLCQVQYGNASFTAYSFVQKQVLGRPIEFVWQRDFILDPSGDIKRLRLAGMKLGKVPVNQKLWPHVNQLFYGCDQALIKQFDWVPKLPAVYITNNEANSSLELRLYSVKP